MIEAEIQEVTMENPIDAFVAKVKDKLDTVPTMFIQPKFLHEIGIFGSHSAAAQAVSKGELPHVKVSPYRILIQKEDVITFLKEKYRAKNKVST